MAFDDSFEAVETFNEELRWRLRESLFFSAGGGAVRRSSADCSNHLKGMLFSQVRSKKGDWS